MSDYQTTVRLDPSIKACVDRLKTLQKFTLNRLINDALAKHLDDLLAEKSVSIAASRDALQAYHAFDPDFEAAIADIASAESAGHHDPVEGSVVSGSVSDKGEYPNAHASTLQAILDG